MSKLKNLSAKEVIKIFDEFGFIVAGQRGSHVKLSRYIGAENEKQIITIPNYQEISKGTIKAIYNQASRYIAEDELRKHFYSK